MRVVFASHRADVIGGGEISLLLLMGELWRTGFQVTLCIPGAGELERRARAEGIPVRIVPMPPLGLTSLRSLYLWKRAASELEPHILHANTSRAAVYAGITGRILNIPVVFHCRIADKDRRLDWLLVRLATHVIANSQATARRFSPWPGLPVDVVYNGVPLPKESESKIDKKPFGAGQLLLCVARVSRWKRHDIVLDVFRDLAERFPDLHLALAGGADPDDEEWWHRIQRLSLEHPAAGRIHWLGMADELSAWYRASDVLLLASEREPFGRVLIEAMAHGLPVVASRGGGVPEIVEDGRQGFLPEPGDVEGMTKAVRQLLSDPELQKRMGKLGVKRARLFSLEAHVEGVRGVYDRVLKPKDAR